MVLCTNCQTVIFHIPFKISINCTIFALNHSGLMWIIKINNDLFINQAQKIVVHIFVTAVSLGMVVVVVMAVTIAANVEWSSFHDQMK